MNLYAKLWSGCLSLLLLAGCSGRELESTALVRTLGVDGGGAGVRLTAASGAQDLGQMPAGLAVATGPSLPAAVSVLAGQGEDYPSCTHVTQLVVGTGADLYHILMDGVAHRETGYSATVWLAAWGTAGDLLECADGDPVKRLDALEENSGVKTKNVLDALVELTERGRVTLPVLSHRAGELTWEGYRVVEMGDAGGQG